MTAVTGLAHLRSLFEELGDLKRIRTAGRDGSIAMRLFARAWGALLAGTPAVHVARDLTAAALCAARLGDLDTVLLRQCGLEDADVANVRLRAFAEVAAVLDTGSREFLRAGVVAEHAGHVAPLPRFVALLAAQPRAGVTCPGVRRIILEPPENHAEHCLLVAVYGVLLCPHYGADPATVFVAALAHHLHNAVMPDSGFTGEMLLGEHLQAVMAAATAHALGELASSLRTDVEHARRILPDTSTPEGRAFHAADVIDRVLQIAQHLQGATLTMRTVLDDMHLVHDGPVKPFHDEVLAQVGLA